MQFQSVIAVLSLALVATAMPTKPTSTTTTTVSGNQVCKANQTALYCPTFSSSSVSSTGGLIGSLIPIGGLTLPLLNCLSVIPIASGNQQAANVCCDTSGVQQGLVNVGTPCVPIQL